MKPFMLFTVAGLKFYDYYNLPASQLVGRVVELIPEPTNPYDPNAIKVMLGGKQVGHVPRDQTAELHYAWKTKRNLTAIIVSHYPKAIIVSVQEIDQDAFIQKALEDARDPYADM